MRLRSGWGALGLALAVCPSIAVAQSAAAGDASTAGAASAVSKAAANPDSTGTYHIGDGVSEPQLIYSVNPEFTPKSVWRSFSGSCAMEFTIDVKGEPQNIRIVQSMGTGKPESLRAQTTQLDRDAVSAVKQYRFVPAMFQGKAVPVRVKLQVDLSVI